MNARLVAVAGGFVVAALLGFVYVLWVSRLDLHSASCRPPWELTGLSFVPFGAFSVALGATLPGGPVDHRTTWPDGRRIVRRREPGLARPHVRRLRRLHGHWDRRLLRLIHRGCALSADWRGAGVEAASASNLRPAFRRRSPWPQLCPPIGGHHVRPVDPPVGRYRVEAGAVIIVMRFGNRTRTTTKGTHSNDPRLLPRTPDLRLARCAPAGRVQGLTLAELLDGHRDGGGRQACTVSTCARGAMKDDPSRPVARGGSSRERGHAGRRRWRSVRRQCNHPKR